LDKDEIVRTIMLGFAEPGSDGYTAILERMGSSKCFSMDRKNHSQDQMKELAEKILDDLGFKKGADGIRVMPNGTRLEFNLWILSEYSDYVSLAYYVQRKLGEIGIKINVAPMASQTVIQRVYYGPPFDYDLYFMGI
jgi:peptide/nickel transport system substrate-binding protein